ncbi:MAG: hypothetical protein ACQERF_09175 [Actinomycetota bacterium]
MTVHALSSRRQARSRLATATATAAGALAAALALAACGSTDDDAAATSPAASTNVATTAPVETPAPSTGLPRDPAAPVPSSAFFAGVEEAWTVPGTAMQDTAGSVSADRSMIGMWAGTEGALQVFELTPTEAAPIWEGQCATAHWWADRLVCGGDVVDPRTGESAALPAGVYAGSNAETLVLRDGDTWVAYDTALTEVWRSEVLGDGMVYGFTDLPVAMAVDTTTFDFHTVDLRTGEATPTMMTVLLVDGYLESTDATGAVVARDLSGTVVAERPLAVPECIPPYGERQVLADRLECPVRYEGETEADGMSSFLLRGEDAPSLLELVPSGFTVDGETFDAGERGLLMAWMFGDEEHFLARFDSGWGLYATGSPDPVWELDANDLLVAAEDVLVAYGDGGTVTLVTPAG